MKTPVNPSDFYAKIVNAQVAAAEQYVDPEWKLTILTYSNGLSQVYIEAKAPDGTVVQTYRFFAPYEAPPPPPPVAPIVAPPPQKKQLPFSWADLLKSQGVVPQEPTLTQTIPDDVRSDGTLAPQDEAAVLENSLREGGLQRLLEMAIKAQAAPKATAAPTPDPAIAAWEQANTAEAQAQAIADRAAAIAKERQSQEERERINANFEKLFPGIPRRPM